MTRPTWKQAITIMKQLQLEYGLPIFAATYQGSCSCCAEVSDLNDEAYLSSTVKNLDWDDIDSYLIFANAHNRGGEANLGGEFGDVFDYVTEKSHHKKQYVFTQSPIDTLVSLAANGHFTIVLELVPQWCV